MVCNTERVRFASANAQSPEVRRAKRAERAPGA